MREKIVESLKMVYSAYQCGKTWYQRQQEWRYMVQRLKVFSLSYIMLSIGAKGLQRHTILCCTLSSAITIGARQCYYEKKNIKRLNTKALAIELTPLSTHLTFRWTIPLNSDRVFPAPSGQISATLWQISSTISHFPEGSKYHLILDRRLTIVLYYYFSSCSSIL